MSQRWMQSFIIMSLAATAGLAVLWRMSEAGWAEHSSNGAGTRQHELLDDVVRLLKTYYDGPVDETTVYHGALMGAAGSLGDPYTELQPPVEAVRHREEVEGEFGGIGVTIIQRPDGTLEIRSVREGSPAAALGLTAGDVIVAAAGESLRGRKMEEARGLIRGKPGSEVEITVDRNGEEMPVKVVRETVVQPAVTGARVLPGTGGIGYLRLVQFTEHTHRQFRDAIAKLTAEGMQSLVIDLRDNPGGRLEAAVQVIDDLTSEEGRLIASMHPESPEVEKRRRALGGTPEMTLAGREERTQDKAALVECPVVLLVDNGSASASEVMAGALSDWGVAYVIGEPTFGKALVQLGIPLPRDQRYVLKVTVSTYTTPLGHRFQRSDGAGSGGLHPDLWISMNNQQRRRMQIRFNIMNEGIPAEPERQLTEAELAAWNEPDVHLAAAIDYLNGVPVVPSNGR